MIRKKVLILGAGPAGLALAYKLSNEQVDTVIIELDKGQVGGLSKTINHNGFLIDIGGHRFYTKSSEVMSFWKELLKEDWLKKERYSRIYYKNIFFDYPLRPIQCLLRLSFIKSIKILFSFFISKIFNVKKAHNLEEWFTQKFGKELYLTFFKSYTEKVWGLKCRDISKDWAAQRIQDLSFYTIFKNSFKVFLRLNSNNSVKTLTSSFLYPRLGPGMLWDTCAKICQERGTRFFFGTNCEKIEFNASTKKWHGYFKNSEQHFDEGNFDYVVSSIPIPSLINCIEQLKSKLLDDLVSKFKFRDFIIVLMVLKKENTLKDQWIYVHNENVQVGRVQVFNNWSEEMVVKPSENLSLGLEYFCQDSDKIWSETDSNLIELAKSELVELNLASQEDLVFDSKVIRVKKAYPVYHESYADDLVHLKESLSTYSPSLFLIGRNGMHRYNNQDHSIMTAFIVGDNILERGALKDSWKVNQEALYIENV